jgi:DNA-binding SARP family transcriptional activator
MAPEPLWRIDLFGGLRALGRDRSVTRLRTQKTGALLAYLALFRNRSHPREQLAELLWPGRAPAAGRGRLREALSSLRRQLEPPGVPRGAVLVSDGGAVALHATRCTTDVAALEADLDRAARAADDAERRRALERALEL